MMLTIRTHRVMAAGFLLLVFASSAIAALPVVERLDPLGVKAGEETTIVFHGQRLGDAHDVLSDNPAVEIVKVNAVDAKKVEVTVKTRADLPPGLYPLRLATETGVANLRLLAVGHLPVVREAEPNSAEDQPQRIELGRTVEGIITNEDVDRFEVELAAGQRVTAEVEGIRLGFDLRNRAILDPYLAILDSEQNELVASDDTALFRQDGLCTLTAPKDGLYTILVRDSSFRGNPLCGYRLHVGDFPRPTAIFPAGGTPGSVLSARWTDVDGSSHEADFQLPSLPDDRHPIIVQDDRGGSPSPNHVRVNDLPVVVETEPNNNYREAPEQPMPLAFCGVIQEPDDFDCFSVPCVKGRKYEVRVFARDILRSPLDAVLNVFGPDHKTISSSDDVAGRMDPSLQFTAKVDGPHTVRVYDHLRRGDDSLQYRIEVSETNPGFDLSLKELRRDESTPILIPAGGRGAVMVTARRRDFGGAIAVDLPELPEGVQATTFDIPAGRVEIPVLLTAEPDSSPTAKLISLSAKPADGKPLGMAGQFSQHHKMVLGQNRRAMWTTDTDTAVCAIVQPAPFDIQLVQPATPIVRQGSKNLTVKLTRDEGFEGDVSIRTLYNPPGVRVNNSRRLRKGQTEVEIPITANGSAAVGTWPLIMTATFSSKTGTRVVATNAIELRVEKPFFKVSFPRTVCTQGQSSAVQVKVESLREFDDSATIELVGLPNGVSAEDNSNELTDDDDKVSFPIEVADKAKTGTHKTLVCIARLDRDGETITQTMGTGELRVDPPVNRKKKKDDQAASDSKPVAAKPLSRLEQLRQQRGELP